ncbi:fatty acid desaturase [Mycolicibacterium sp.]|uniref:fatty acid desaturase n=1 Tax=Mycolicibacterium sp. TaxID=2320850 RepID=UPI003D0D0A99
MTAQTTDRPLISRRVFKLENPANIGPLIHILLWLALLAVGLLTPAVEHWYLAVPLVILLSLLNLSLTIGVLHMHTHRPLAVSRRVNRAIDLLCALPGGLTEVDMREVHIINHHRFNDGPRDITTTAGREHGLRAIWYWVSYSPMIHLHTIRMLFAPNISAERRKRRHRYLTDVAALVVLIGATAYFADPLRFAVFYLVPFVLVQINAGYFAWLTHAPARVFDDDPSRSINTVGNILNFLTFNQGYHSVHHRYPGIHWTEIPDKLDFMRDVDPGAVVPYWMTLNSAWRVLTRDRFRDASYGQRWKAKLEDRLAHGGARARYLPWFAWV